MSKKCPKKWVPSVQVVGYDGKNLQFKKSYDSAQI